MCVPPSLGVRKWRVKEWGVNEIQKKSFFEKNKKQLKHTVVNRPFSAMDGTPEADTLHTQISIYFTSTFTV